VTTPTTPTTDPQQALDEVAAYIRDRYRTANHLHIHRYDTGSVIVTEVFDQDGQVLDDDEHAGYQWDEIDPQIRLVARTHCAHGPAHHPECNLIMLPSQATGVPALRHLESLLYQVIDGQEQPEDQVYMWEITSGERDHAIIGAGLFPIAPGLKQQAVAERLRDLMVELSDDPSISVTVCPWDHDGGSDYSRVGIAEPDEDEEDPEVINELESIGREDDDEGPDTLTGEVVTAEERAAAERKPKSFSDLTWSEPKSVSLRDLHGWQHEPEDEEPGEEEMAAEVGEIMRESLEAAEDIRNYPDGTRFLPRWDQDPPEPADYCTAVLVPVDETRPCIRITLPHRATGDYWTELGRHVGGSPNACQYDRDALVYVENNSTRDSAPNRRLTRYIWGHSEASAHHQTDPENPDYYLHGDAVVIGADRDLDPVDVPRRIEAHFHVDEPLAGGAAARETGE